MGDSLLDLQKSISDIKLQDLSKSVKISHILKFIETKRDNPSLSKENICKGIGISSGKINKYFDEFGVVGFTKKRNKNTKHPVIKSGGVDMSNSDLINHINI